MPAKVHRLAKKLERQGYSESAAWAIAYAAAKKWKKHKRGHKSHSDSDNKSSHGGRSY